LTAWLPAVGMLAANAHYAAGFPAIPRGVPVEPVGGLAWATGMPSSDVAGYGAGVVQSPLPEAQSPARNCTTTRDSTTSHRPMPGREKARGVQQRQKQVQGAHAGSRAPFQQPPPQRHGGEEYSIAASWPPYEGARLPMLPQVRCRKGHVVAACHLPGEQCRHTQVARIECCGQSSTLLGSARP
jgi:hypothetical protein